MTEFTIVQLNDLHGYVEPHPEWLWTANGFEYRVMGGLARIKTLVRQIRADDPYVLFADNGDTFHGTRPVVESKGELLLPLLKELDLHAMTGHWDFAYGPGHLQELSAALPYPFLAANVYERDSDRLVFPPVTRVDLGPICVGIVGLACNIVDKVMPPHFSEGVRFTTGEDELPHYIAQLRGPEHCDVVVLLSHLGLPQDLELLTRVPGVDVCLSSHTHHRLERPVMRNGSIVIQSGCHGSFLGKLKLGYKNGRVELLAHELVHVDEAVEPNPTMQALIDSALDGVEVKDSTVGTTPAALHRATMLESPADNLLLHAMRAATGSELAFINGWRYGAPIPPGPITEEALFNFAPMNPEITTVRLSGSELRDMIEENLERTFSRDVFGQMGGYIKRCGGMKTYFKVEDPKGSRVQAIFVGDEPLDPARDYSAAYVTMQAVPEKYGSDRVDTGKHLVEAAVQYLASQPTHFGEELSFVEV
jgi:5''-nucleotidase/2'',3''-cyclic phosphodiesterase and related esterases